MAANHYHIVVAISNGKHIVSYLTFNPQNLDTCIYKFMALSKELATAQVGDFTDSFSALRDMAEQGSDFFITSQGSYFTVAFLDCGGTKIQHCPFDRYLN